MAFLLTREEAKEKGRDLVGLTEQDIRDRKWAIDKRTYVRNMYFGVRLRDLRYKGQSDIHLFVMSEKIEVLVAKIMNAFFGAEPHAHAKRVPHDSNPNETEAIETHTNWAVDTDIPNFHSTFESWVRNTLIDGVSVLMPWYNYQQRRTLIVEIASTLYRAEEVDLAGERVPETRLKVPAEILGELFQNLEIVAVNDQTGEAAVANAVEETADLVGMEFVVNFAEDHVDYENVLVTFRPSRFTDSIEAHILRPIEVNDNVEVDLLEYEDVIVPFRTKDLQCNERAVRQYWQTLSDVEQKRLREEWMLDEEDMKILRARGQTDNRHEEHPEDRRKKRQIDTITGHRGQDAPQTTSSDEIKAYRDNKILIWEYFVKDDLDGDGIPEEYIYQIPYGLKRIVKTEYLEERCPHGQRPLIDLHSTRISNRFYSQSVGDWLAPVNAEVNTIINMVNESQELINNPFFFYVPMGFPADEKIVKGIRPGMGIPVMDINSIMFPKWPQQPLANLSTIDHILMFADRLTVAPQAGGSTQVRNAPRTARGTLALLSEANIKVDSYVQAAQKGGWSELMYQIYALYDAFGSADKFESVTGHPKPKSRPQDIRNRVIFTFSGNTVNTNKEVMRTISQLMYTILAQEPLYMTDMKARRNLIKLFIRHFGSDIGINMDEILPALPGLPGTTMPMSQATETQMMKQGTPVDVHPLDDDAAHMREMEQEQNGRGFESWDPASVALYASHFAQHARQLSLKQQQGQVAGGGQGNNAPLTASADLGTLEGGPT
jgi:hypothetical protein